ncbi:hypothetical protein ABB30_05300 [Stenotrophomonas ginsengisoli]|uniref:Argininosuccinate lyase n=1 Tax=Stenotrophomonas ginsengisoli TaxID=336566 RepID=A0A0R0DII1_9GAMM|nr:hypothetical protein [Stenotrophomonas ginsengisoli]KRG78135.1 hypothetical protein ABB30_05300 [Stenotrophomonas ginsengisoli]
MFKSAQIIVLAALLLLVSVAAHAQQRYLRVTNNTGFDIITLNVSSSSTGDWEEDVLGTRILRNGQTHQVNFSGKGSPVYDIKAVDEDGDTYYRMGVNVLTEDVTLTLGDLSH